MRYEVRNSGGGTCPHCGAHELLATAKTAEDLSRDVVAHIRELHACSRWWQWLFRRRLRQLAGFHDGLVESLRKQTFYV